MRAEQERISAIGYFSAHAHAGLHQICDNGSIAAPDNPTLPTCPEMRGTEMFHVVLVEPEIAPNTGNIARLCAAVGCRLHLVGRLGFQLAERAVRRAGLDYWEHVDLARHPSWEAFEAAMTQSRIWCFSARARRPYTEAGFRDGDCLVFGGESRGLPAGLLDRFSRQALYIPMPSRKVRSLNLATAVGIVLYEALRQTELAPSTEA